MEKMPNDKNEQTGLTRRQVLFGGAAVAAGALGVNEIYGRVVDQNEKQQEIDDLYRKFLGYKMNPELFNSLIQRTEMSLVEASETFKLFDSTESGIPEAIENIENLAKGFSASKMVEYAKVLAASEVPNKLTDLIVYYEDGSTGTDAPIFATIAIVDEYLRRVGLVADRIMYDSKPKINQGLDLDPTQKLPITKEKEDVRPEDLKKDFDDALTAITSLREDIQVVLTGLKDEAARMAEENNTL